MSDTLLAFQAFVDAGNTRNVSVAIKPDPLGPVNRIVELRNGDRRVKAALCRVPAGATVELVHRRSGFDLPELFAYNHRLWDTRGRHSLADAEVELPTYRPPGWYIEIDGQTVLYATEAEVWPLPPAPPIPWRVRTKRAVRRGIEKRLRPHTRFDARTMRITGRR